MSLQDTYPYASSESRCPRCGDNEIDSTYEGTDGDYVSHSVDCNNCGLEWKETYTLSYRDFNPIDGEDGGSYSFREGWDE